ncbi:MAG: DUF2218 domain-containing protein [Acetobacteraceae bacterium]|nr:DUF2218 domain-containing protein [Acetobacteraceae bacterium]
MAARLRQEAVLYIAGAAQLLASLIEQLEGRAPIRREADTGVIDLGAARCALCVAGDRLLACCEADEAPALRRLRALLDGQLACCSDGTAGLLWGPAHAVPAQEPSAPLPEMCDAHNGMPWLGQN